MNKYDIENLIRVLRREERKDKYGFKDGEMVRFTVDQIKKILEDYYLDTFCKRKGCSSDLQMYCCGCQEYFKWEEQEKEKNRMGR